MALRGCCSYNKQVRVTFDPAKRRRTLDERGLDFADATILERYERWRRFDSAVSAAAFDNLNRIFSNDGRLARSAREVGLGIVDRLPMLKRWLVDEAAGVTGDIPRLLRGLPV